MSYLCNIKEGFETSLREVYFTKEFDEFYDAQTIKVQEKFDYVKNILRRENILTEKFVKKIQKTEFYEIRIGIGNNAYPSLFFAIDHENATLARKVILLSAFLKRSDKDYKKEVAKARNILERYK